MASRRDAIRFAVYAAMAVSLEHGVPSSAGAQVEGPNQPSPTSRADPDASENAYALDGVANFKAIYGDARLRNAFYLFLKNVYNLYPEDRFHHLIDDVARGAISDRDIYNRVQKEQKLIEPFLSEVRYALPALARQKAEMARETLAILGSSPRIDGYMEIGTTGRYIGKLKGSVDLTGDVVLVNATEPGFSPVDLVERGQLTRIGRYVPLKDYAPITTPEVPDRSLDVVANFIGFHHSPADRRDAFVRSIWRVLRPGGRLILRDHDVDSAEMNHMVALAHDVFNMGLGVPWEVNQREIRHFTSIPEIADYLGTQGFRLTTSKRPLLQPGDPTHNALMEFVRV